MRNPFADGSGLSPDVVMALISKASTEVHRILGPGWPVEFYTKALALAFQKEGLNFEQEKVVTVSYAGVEIGEARLPFVVEGQLVILSADEGIRSNHFLTANALLKVSGCKSGHIVNFGAAKMEAKKLLANPLGG